MENSKVSALEGRELADDYERKQVQQGRWAETWDVVKGSLTKIIFINVLVLLFLVPSIAVIFIRNYVYIPTYGALYPFNSNFGVGYPALPDVVGMQEQIILSADLMFYSLLILSGFIASIGIAGGAYSTKRLINTRGEFTVKGFFHGVKVSYFNTIIPVTLFLAFLFATVIIGDWANYMIALGSDPVWPTVAKVCAIAVTVFVGIVSMWLLAVGTSYKVSVWQTVKSSFTLLFATPVHSIFFAGFALVPAWLLLIFQTGFMFTLITMVCLMFGLSFVFIVWMSYTQWVFDIFIKPDAKAKASDGKAKAEKEVKLSKAEEEKQIAMQLLAAGKSELIGKPILPIDGEKLTAVPKVFGRRDILSVREEKALLDKKVAAYFEEHKNDKQFAEYNKMFADRDKPVEVKDKKGKKAKLNPDKLLR